MSAEAVGPQVSAVATGGVSVEDPREPARPQSVRGAGVQAGLGISSEADNLLAGRPDHFRSADEVTSGPSITQGIVVEGSRAWKHPGVSPVGCRRLRLQVGGNVRWDDCPALEFIRQLEEPLLGEARPEVVVNSCGACATAEGSGWPEKWGTLLGTQADSLLGDPVASSSGDQPVVRRKEVRSRVTGAEAAGVSPSVAHPFGGALCGGSPSRPCPRGHAGGQSANGPEGGTFLRSGGGFPSSSGPPIQPVWHPKLPGFLGGAAPGGKSVVKGYRWSKEKAEECGSIEVRGFRAVPYPGCCGRPCALHGF